MPFDRFYRWLDISSVTACPSSSSSSRLQQQDAAFKHHRPNQGVFCSSVCCSQTSQLETTTNGRFCGGRLGGGRAGSNTWTLHCGGQQQRCQHKQRDGRAFLWKQWPLSLWNVKNEARSDVAECPNARFDPTAQKRQIYSVKAVNPHMEKLQRDILINNQKSSLIDSLSIN